MSEDSDRESKKKRGKRASPVKTNKRTANRKKAADNSDDDEEEKAKPVKGKKRAASDEEDDEEDKGKRRPPAKTNAKQQVGRKQPMFLKMRKMKKRLNRSRGRRLLHQTRKMMKKTVKASAALLRKRT